MKKVLALVLTVLALVLSVGTASAQTNLQQTGTTLVQSVPPINYQIPISATAAVNAQTTLTIPAPPPNQFIYVCMLQMNTSMDATGAAVSNLVTTSTNFNNFAMKFSAIAGIGVNYDGPQFGFGSPATGCAKSTLAGTATTFVSPAASTHAAFTWYAAYYYGF